MFSSSGFERRVALGGPGLFARKYNAKGVTFVRKKEKKKMGMVRYGN